MPTGEETEVMYSFAAETASGVLALVAAEEEAGALDAVVVGAAEVEVPGVDDPQADRRKATTTGTAQRNFRFIGLTPEVVENMVAVA
jgi:hypothetical protein